MIDATVQCFIERVVDSPVKLQLLLMFHDNPWMEWSATRIAERIYRDIWSTRAALCELANDGLLSSAAVVDSEPVYAYCPRADHIDSIARLCNAYNEPLEREGVQRIVREAASLAPYRRSDEAFFDSEFASY